MSRLDHTSPSPDAVARAASRFWEERAKGRTLSIDEVLDSAPGSPGHDVLRASAIRAIAQRAVTLASDPSIPPNEKATLLGPTPQPNPEDSVVLGGPLPTIEGYDLVCCLGRGGMGAVFEGYQQSTGRRVAIKFMLDHAGSSEAARKRFELEVDVVAKLQHPGIVSVFDSGVRKGRYFYVMEYVAGRPLDAAMKPGECDTRSALNLIARVCDAVDYAHQRGVLHRDLKPSNIIVDDHGLPHLLDFGLAKQFDPASKTNERHGAMGLTVSGPGQLMGTVAYMSPEQAHGQHDQTSVRTDVYSLGAIAFELLTGQLPSGNSGSLREILDRITQVDPAAPSTMRPGLSRDLDAVILHALEKSPDRRYATAGEFAADIRRALAHEPVLARRVNAAGRAWRWVRRNRAISTISAAAVVTLIVVSTLLVVRIIRESKIAARERDVARENFGRLRSILESADPVRNPGLTVIQLLDSATKGLDDSPPAQDLAEAQIREILGSVYLKSTEYAKARNNLAKALAIRERHAASRDEPVLADDLHNLAASLWWDGEYDQAEKYYVRSLFMRQRMYKGDNAAVAMSLTHLAACRLRTGKSADAKRLYTEALEMRRRMYGAEHEEVAQSLNNLAKCYLDADDLGQAEPLFREALQMILKLRGDKNTGTAAASQNLAECLLRHVEAAHIAGDQIGLHAWADAAKEALERALAIRTATYPGGNNLVAASLGALARAQMWRGELSQAKDLAQRSVDMLRTRRAGHPDLADALYTLATVLMAQNDSPGAVAALQEALIIGEAARPRMELLVARVRGELGLALANSERAEEGRKAVVQALQETRAFRGDESLDTVLAARRVVEFYVRRGDTVRAAEYRGLAKLSP